MGIQERKERERERRRQQIMVAAKRVFSQKGYNKATMEDIAGEAELSPGTLYLYFKNKEELYASLSLRILHYLNIRVQHVSNEKNLDPKEKMAALREAMFDVYNFDPITIINLFHLQSSETLRNLSSEFLDEIMDLSRKTISGLARIFETGIKAGFFVDKHPHALADIYFSIFSGVILWEASKNILDQGKNYLEATLGTAFDLFMDGITKKT